MASYMSLWGFRRCWSAHDSIKDSCVVKSSAKIMPFVSEQQCLQVSQSLLSNALQAHAAEGNAEIPVQARCRGKSHHIKEGSDKPLC